MARAKSKSNTQPKATREQPQRSNIVPRKMTFDENTLSKLVKNLDTRLGGSEAPEKRRGKKRSRDGAVLGRDSTTEEEWLKQEILALGGTDEDYDLVLEVASASDVDEVASFEDSSGSAKRDNKLLKQLSELVKDVEVPDDASESAEITESASADEGPSQKKQAAVERGLKGNQITQGQSDLHINPQPDWYNVQLPALPQLPSEVATLPQTLLDRIHQHATSLLEAEVQSYNDRGRTSSSQKFYDTMAASGTLDDKIAALTLALQESPLHNTRALQSLLNLARKRSRGQAINVLKALKDLFAQSTLLPSNRRLKTFSAQPDLAAAFTGHNDWAPGSRLPGRLRVAHLISWAFESWLKDTYFEILKILETWCNDEIEYARRQSVSYVYELLENKPEQESNLLRLLVNKLGDPDKKIASRTSYLILKLEEAHPRMKSTVISAVQSDILFRPGQSQHAKYYAIITLNQTVLSSREEEVASMLLDVYFRLFFGLLRPVDDKRDQYGIPGRVKAGKQHKKDSSAGRDMSKAHIPEEEMRQRLIAGVLTGVNRAYPYTNSESTRLSKHIDTLFRVTHSSNFNTSIQALMLVQQLSASHQMSTERFFRTLYESLLDPRILSTSKQTMYMNLLYEALKEDVDLNRVKAFIKRLFQVLSMHEPSFIYGSFHLIKELEKTFPSITSLIDQPEHSISDDDDEEVFRDVPDEGDPRQPSTVTPEHSPKDGQTNSKYDPRKRDPSHATAERSPLWELLPFLTHFHPSISLGAHHIISHTKLEGQPDLTQHTLKHFLDRFVYRNPKSSSATVLRGSSIMQPLAAAGEASGLLVRPDAKARAQAPVNTEGFWSRKTEDVAPEDVFFHQYFSSVGKDKRKTGVEKKAMDADGADFESDEYQSVAHEDEIWNALVNSQPELEGDSEDDDLDMDALESEFEKGEDDEDEENQEEVLDGVSVTDDHDGDFAVGNADANVSDSSALDFDGTDDGNSLDSDASVSAAEEAAQEAASAAASASSRDKPAPRRRKLKQLPTFASAEDYAAMLDDDDGEDVGRS